MSEPGPPPVRPSSSTVGEGTPPTTAGPERRELWLDARAVSRARRLLFLFLVNWALMGWLMVVLGRDSQWMGWAAMALGLLIFFAALAQLRTLRYAGRLPLVVVDDDALHFRYPSGTAFETVPWQRLTGLEYETGSASARLLRDGEGALPLPLGPLRPEDRQSVLDEIGRRLPSSERATD